MVQRLIKNSTVKVTEALQAALMEYANQRKSVVGPEGILVALIDQKIPLRFSSSMRWIWTLALFAGKLLIWQSQRSMHFLSFIQAGEPDSE